MVSASHHEIIFWCFKKSKQSTQRIQQGNLKMKSKKPFGNLKKLQKIAFPSSINILSIINADPLNDGAYVALLCSNHTVYIYHRRNQKNNPYHLLHKIEESLHTHYERLQIFAIQTNPLYNHIMIKHRLSCHVYNFGRDPPDDIEMDRTQALQILVPQGVKNTGFDVLVPPSWWQSKYIFFYSPQYIYLLDATNPFNIIRKTLLNATGRNRKLTSPPTFDGIQHIYVNHSDNHLVHYTLHEGEKYETDIVENNVSSVAIPQFNPTNPFFASWIFISPEHAYCLDTKTTCHPKMTYVNNWNGQLHIVNESIIQIGDRVHIYHYGAPF
mmetsp:Transcript_501/g.892  ORF Transcript_501/g.892 Transcript_501/m.892 type:complete len:326 (+) Transcript_501:1-978(+)